MSREAMDGLADAIMGTQDLAPSPSSPTASPAEEVDPDPRDLDGLASACLQVWADGTPQHAE